MLNLSQITVLICTFRRNELLRNLLDEISEQCLVLNTKLRVVVVDNSPNQEARAVVEKAHHEALAKGYLHEPQNNISRARNAAVNAAQTPLVLFLDDDQMLPPNFFKTLPGVLGALDESSIAGICFKKVYSPDSVQRFPAHLQGVLQFPGGAHLRATDRRQFGTGGLLMKRRVFLYEKFSFDEALGLVGSEDTDFFLRLRSRKRVVLYCDAPFVFERLSADRLTPSYLKRSYFRKGYCDALLFARAKPVTLPAYILLSVCYLVISSLKVALSFTRTGRAQSFALFWRQVGKISFLFGQQQTFYGVNKPIAVLHVTQKLGLGGAEKLLEQIAWQSRGLPGVNFFFYNSPGTSSADERIRSAGHKLYQHEKGDGFDWRLLFKLARTCRLNRIDVVHTHDVGGMFYATLAKILVPRLRLVHTMHTLHSWRGNEKYRYLQTVCALFYSRIVCVSSHVKEQLDQLFIFSKSKTFVVHNGIDVAHFRAELPQLQNQRLMLASVCRISAEKNLMETLRVCADLRDAGVPFEFHHAGGGDPIILKQMQDYIREHALGTQVFLHGPLDDVSEVLRKCQIFISTSLEECMPLAVLEAMAMGLVCICSDIAAHRDLSRYGIITVPNKYQNFTQVIRDVLTKGPQEFSTLSASLAQAARSNFSINSMLDNYLLVYRRSINKMA